MAVLAGDGGVLLVLTRCAEPSYPKTFHLGFLVDDPGQVAAKHAELAAAAVSGLSPVQQMRGGPGFYCRTEWGILLEVSWRIPLQAN